MCCCCVGRVEAMPGGVSGLVPGGGQPGSGVAPELKRGLSSPPFCVVLRIKSHPSPRRCGWIINPPAPVTVCVI